MSRTPRRETAGGRAARGRRRSPWLWLGAFAVAALGMWALVSRGPSSPRPAERPALAPVTGPLHFPGSVPAEVRELYEFAARRPDVLHYVPCFCGCWQAGHRSAYDCFIDRVHADGRVEIDPMGFT